MSLLAAALICALSALSACSIHKTDKTPPVRVVNLTVKQPGFEDRVFQLKKDARIKGSPSVDAAVVDVDGDNVTVDIVAPSALPPPAEASSDSTVTSFAGGAVSGILGTIILFVLWALFWRRQGGSSGRYE